MTKYAKAIQRYYADLKGSPLKETPRREKFLILLQELFPNSVEELRKYTDGAEQSVKVKTSGNELIKTGSIDAFFGDLIIEFERSIPAKKTEAERQLQEYCSGIWNAEATKRPYICIATDGITWHTYFPASDKTSDILTEDVELQPKEIITLSDDPASWEAFFLFLNRLFFREGRLKPTVENFTKDFGLGSYLFESVSRELRSSLREVINESEIALSYSEWSHYLSYTYGSLLTNEELFCKHAYLCTLSRFIVWAALSHNGPAEPTSRGLLISLIRGGYFDRVGILNLAEKDFFHWIGHEKVLRRLEGFWLRVLNQLKTYDFGEIDEDLLKGVYQELVDPTDRHDLGEYYTPDWLCEKIANYLVTKPKGRLPSVIDLTCGSGSFLRAAVRRIYTFIQNQAAKTDLNSALQAIIANVHGIDIHPLAVMISKANYILALRELLPHKKKPIHLPVYLADSLFMPQTDDIKMHEYHRKNVIIRFLGEKYILPQTFFADAQAFDSAIALCFDVAENLASNEAAESREGFINSLRKVVSHLNDPNEIEDAAKHLFRLTQQLATRIREKKNTIWSFILRNNLRPLFLHGAYDVVIGNPPWLSYRFIKDPDYQDEIKRLCKETYDLAPEKPQLFTQMELATLFLVHATQNYLKPGGLLGYVMPRSVFNADQHDKFRTESFDAECAVTEYWDLRHVAPLFRVPASVVFARRAKPEKRDSYKAVFLKGKLPSRDLPLSIALKYLSGEHGTIHLSRLGGRTALSRSQITSQADPSILPYRDRFSQGASIVPRNFYFIVTPTAAERDADEFYAHTDPEQAKEGKPPYKEIFLDGTVETRFLFRTALSRHILPFLVMSKPYILLPVVKEYGQYSLKTATELRTLGYRLAADWFYKAEKEWAMHRAEKADRQSLYQRLNFQSELTKQNPDTDYLILYNKSGTNISASMLSLKELDKPFYADYNTYWAAARSESEAHYLVSILNSRKINEIVKPFQSMGLMGERDICKKILEIPIPEYDKADSTHKRLAEISASAAAKVRELIQKGNLEGNAARMRGKIRESLSSELTEIDEKTNILLALE